MTDLERCRTILYGHQIGETVKGADHDFLVELLGRHPTAAEKIGSGIARFEVRINPRFHKFCFWLIRTDGSSTDFSFMRCLNGAPSHRSLARSAMRAEILPQIHSFKLAGLQTGTRCSVSGEALNENCHVDHHEPSFEELADRFAETEGGYDAIQLTPSLDGHVGRRLADPFLAVRWEDFHREHAHLRLVTAHINLTKKRKRVDDRADE